ncbi:MAG: hypothetical protein VX768_18260, partial [Planctomycetota bacterium]|nr:hypothetical protein [Planctomycetota bacterium]
LLNLTLLGLLLKVASANFGRRGLVVATALALASPLLWFVNKGHTEFFTVCLATTGVIWFLKRRYGRTVLALGIVSTQNPPFLLVALLVVALGIVRDGPKMVRHWVGCLAGMLVGCLHPLYYFIRHGNVTPQLITGAASGEGKGFREWTCFLVDPDVGLFSNWPWLIVPLLAVLAVTFWRKQKPDWSVICFCFLAVTILCWAQTKTNNFNHGGTIKISRYALWYLPFLYPLLDRFARNYPLVPVWQRGAAVAFLLAALVVNTTKFYPDRKESFLFQTTIAENFYEVCPGLYNPIPEIFIERCLQAELPTDQWAISNRSGTKVIVHSGRLIKQQNWLRHGKKLDGIGGCEKRIDPEKLVRVIQQRDQTPDAIEWFYINAPGDIFLEMDVPVLSASDEPKNVLR